MMPSFMAGRLRSNSLDHRLYSAPFCAFGRVCQAAASAS